MSFNISYIFEAIDDFSPTIRHIKSGMRSLQSTLKKLSETMTYKIGRGMSKFGKSMSMYVGAPLVAMGALSIRTANDFDKSLNMVQAVTGATGKQFDSMKKKAMDLGMTTQFTARDAANAMKFLGLSGFKTNEILKAMPGTLQLAAAAQLDMGSAANIVTNILHGYGEKVKDLGHVNDVLTATFTNTNTNLVQLGGAMKMVGPIAHKMSIPIEETTAALGMLGQAGIQGTLAGTSMRRAFLNMAKPVGDAAKIIKHSGLKFVDTKGNLVGMVKVVKQLERAHLTAAGYAALFGYRAGPAMAALVDQGSASIGNLIEKLKHSDGISKRIAKTQMQGLPGAIYKLKAAFEHVQIAVVDANNTLAVGLTGALTKAILSISKLSPHMKRIIVEFGSFGVILGPVVLGLGKMLIIMRLLGMTRLVSVVIAIGAAFTGLALAIGASIAAIDILYTKFKWYRSFFGFVNKGIGMMSGSGGVISNTVLGTMHTMGAAAAAPTQHNVASSLSIKVADKNNILERITGVSDADAFNMSIAPNMLLSRY